MIENKGIKQGFKYLAIFIAGIASCFLIVKSDFNRSSNASVPVEDIGVTFEDVDIGMKLDEVVEVVNLDKEGMIQTEFDDGEVYSISTPINDDVIYTEYLVFIDEKVDIVYDLVELPIKHVDTYRDALLSLNIKRYGETVQESIFTDDDDDDVEGVEGDDDDKLYQKVEEYLWEDDDSGLTRRLFITGLEGDKVGIYNERFNLVDMGETN